MRHAKSAEKVVQGQSPQDETAVRGRREDSDCPRGDAGRGKHCGAVSPRRAELESPTAGARSFWKEARDGWLAIPPARRHPRKPRISDRRMAG